MKDIKPNRNTNQQRGGKKVILTLHQAASFLNVPLSTMHCKVARREIPAYFKERKLLFFKKDLEACVHDGMDNGKNELNNNKGQ